MEGVPSDGKKTMQREERRLKEQWGNLPCSPFVCSFVVNMNPDRKKRETKIAL